MAFLTERTHPESRILSLFPVPLETESRYYWEEDLLEMGFDKILDGLPEDTAEIVFRNAGFLADTKPELAFYFLRKHEEILRLIGPGEIDRWTRLVLEIFDTKGLNPALDFIRGLEKHPDFDLYWGEGVSFDEVHGVLTNYLHALGEEDLHLEPGPRHTTDMVKVVLPGRISVLPARDDNFLLYKLMVTHKAAQVRLGTYRLNLGSLRERMGPSNPFPVDEPAPETDARASELGRFLEGFEEPELAEDLYNFVENLRIERWIETRLPGLFREMKPLKRRLGLRRTTPRNLPPKSLLMESILNRHLTGTPGPQEDSALSAKLEPITRLLEGERRALDTPEDAALLTLRIVRLMEGLPGLYTRVASIFYAGELNPEEAERGRRRRRESTRAKFREELAKLVRELPECEEVEIEAPPRERQDASHGPLQRQEVPRHLLIDGNPVPVPQAMGKIIEEIYEDLGTLPSSYLAVTDDMSGHFFRDLCQTTIIGTSNVLSENAEGMHLYDEWDYRRQGYRKRWAVLRETEASEGGISFAEDVLARYGGMVRQIKRHFERIRLEQALLRRQRDGDNVDLDAAIEAFADFHAGVNPSDRLFVRLRRDKRDIATAFLIDLSGSTSGWINEMERTSLLILCEALRVIKDRFAVYGFSGRTRKRCELFRIKGFDESYGDMVKRRIANLRALDYTRMGPPIRHLTELLRTTEAKTRLLITLSDGKPDDYDGYRGDYGIEDTRHALLESKRAGIHPFCITIDKAEHSYLSHMYGPVNYVFIDDISKLPVKVPEVYRKLTARGS